MDRSELLTRTCRFQSDGILRVTFLPGARVGLDDARENVAVTSQLANGGRLPILVDLRGVHSQSGEARAYLAGPEATKVSLAVALLIGNPLSRVIGNFYLGFNRPSVPTQLFTDEAAAVAWLKSVQSQP